MYLLNKNVPAFFAAYKLASSCALPMFFLYRILLLPNQLETFLTEREKETSMASMADG